MVEIQIYIWHTGLEIFFWEGHESARLAQVPPGGWACFPGKV